MTSVAPRWPRYRRLRPDIAARPTNVIDTIALFTRSALSTASAASFTRARDTVSLRTVEEMSIPTARGGFFTLCYRARLSDPDILGVGLDDLSHEPVPDDIGIAQIIEADAINARKDALDLHQTRIFALR